MIPHIAAPGEPAPAITWEHDHASDAAYAHLTDHEIVRTVCAGPNVNFDVDWTGRPVGIEVLGSHDWAAALVALFLRGEVRLVHGFDENGVDECGARLAYTDMNSRNSFTCNLPAGHEDAHHSRWSRMTWTATQGAVVPGSDSKENADV